MAYVGSFNDNFEATPSVFGVDLLTGKVTGTVTAVPSPTAPAISPDGSTLYVMSENTSIAAINTASGAVIASLPLAYINPGLIVVKPDGSAIYVATESGVMVLDPHSLAVAATIAGVSPKALVFSSDGSHLYAVNNGNPILQVIDTTSNSVIASVPEPRQVANYVYSGALSPDGQTFYISTQYALLEVSLQADTITGSIIVPDQLTGCLAASADGKSVYACRLANSFLAPGVLQIDLASGTSLILETGDVIRGLLRPAPSAALYLLGAPADTMVESLKNDVVTQRLGSTIGTVSLAISGSGNRVLGVNATDPVPLNHFSPMLSVIDTTAHQVVSRFSLPQTTYLSSSIAINSSGSTGYVAAQRPTQSNPYTSEILALDLASGTVQHAFSSPGLSIPSYIAIAPDDSEIYIFFPDINGNFEACALTLPMLKRRLCAFLQVPTSTSIRGPIVVDATDTSLYTVANGIDANHVFSSYVVEVAVKTLAIQEEIQLPPGEFGSSPESCSLGYSAGSNSLYVACSSAGAAHQVAGAVLRLDLSTFLFGAAQHVNYFPQGHAATPDGTTVLMTGSPDGTQMFDGFTLAYKGLIPGGLGAGIVIAPQ